MSHAVDYSRSSTNIFCLEGRVYACLAAKSSPCSSRSFAFGLQTCAVDFRISSHSFR